MSTKSNNQNGTVKPLPTTPALPEPAPAATAPKPEPVKEQPVKILTPADLIAAKMNSYKQIIIINKQLTNLQATLENLETFEYGAEKDEDDRYQALLTIADDQRKQFTTKNPVLVREVVDYIKKRLKTKIEEKQVDLLSVEL